MKNIATRHMWDNYPIDTPKKLEIDLSFNEDEFYIIQRGLIPEEMEDKWFIFYEDGWLYFHRSWTGFGIYKAQIIKEGYDYYIKEFWVERNQEKFGEIYDENDVNNITFLIFNGLLGFDYKLQYRESYEDIVQNWNYFGNMVFRFKESDLLDNIKSVLFGVAVGDALGVPVEFKSREYLKINPISDMIGYGTYNLPPGTFSDDSSLTFCLAEGLSSEFDLKNIANLFAQWRYNGFWTPYGEVFDIGNTTSKAIANFNRGIGINAIGLTDEFSNGNGSLMRISPLLFYIYDKEINERFELTNQISSLTHAHIISVIACFYYLEFARLILLGKEKFEAYNTLSEEIINFLRNQNFQDKEINVFSRLLNGNIHELFEEEIKSSGYVIHTLEASIWCIMNTNDYSEAVIKAVNLGSDTDTTAAVTGGLAGLIYGFNSIPKKWIDLLAKSEEIEDLSKRFNNRIKEIRNSN
jgi:ADP-ribosyl-[dinitrogen reductase] hydrolase